MKVTITTDGTYSDFNGQFAGATQHKKGDGGKDPDWYARRLIASKAAVMAVQFDIPQEKAVEMLAKLYRKYNSRTRS